MKSENLFYCPHCHFGYEDIQDYGFENIDEEGEFKMECEGCIKEFTVKYKTVIYFDTE